MNTPPLILVVDDDIGAIMLLKIMLQRGGYEVLTARDADSGLQVLGTHSPDLLITDNMMPGMCGADFVRQVKRNPAFAKMPVVLMASGGSASARLDAMEAGVDDVLLKPILHHDLLTTVRAMLENRCYDPIPKGCALLLHGSYPNNAYRSQLAAAVNARIETTMITQWACGESALVNQRMIEALRASRSLTVCLTQETSQHDTVRYACDYFAGHNKPLTAILYEDCDLPDAFNTCHVFAPDDMDAYCSWLRRIHTRSQP